MDASSSAASLVINGWEGREGGEGGGQGGKEGGRVKRELALPNKA